MMAAMTTACNTLADASCSLSSPAKPEDLKKKLLDHLLDQHGDRELITDGFKDILVARERARVPDRPPTLAFNYPHIVIVLVSYHNTLW